MRSTSRFPIAARTLLALLLTSVGARADGTLPLRPDQADWDLEVPITAYETFPLPAPTTVLAEAFLEVRLSAEIGTHIGIGFERDGVIVVTDQVSVSRADQVVRLDISRGLSRAPGASDQAVRLAIGPLLAGFSDAEVSVRPLAADDDVWARVVEISAPTFPGAAFDIGAGHAASYAVNAPPPRVESTSDALPQVSSVLVHPNPFNSSVTFSFESPGSRRVRVALYNLRGQEVAVLHDGEVAAGRHDLSWHGLSSTGAPVASGTYVYRVVAGAEILLGKIVLVK